MPGTLGDVSATKRDRCRRGKGTPFNFGLTQDAAEGW